MQDKKKQAKTPKNPIVWILIFIILFSATMLLWLKSNSIQEAGQRLGVQSQIDKNSSESLVHSTSEVVETSNKAEVIQTTVQESSISNKETNQTSSSTTIEMTEKIESSESFEQAYAQLPAAKTYSIFQFKNNEIQNRFVRRAFEVMIQRLIDEGNFFSAVDYQLTVYPTLDDNIYNLRLEEKYADQLLEQGQYRFDYRGKKVTKY
ncbi:hypothetical protein [Facklamia sp. 7083-14-GEN3]|uniref:hypothetical protein n=1 Tax=Facklamia sp. 7083-14-GEN3 TaxID=2973478 RepID=UPI00215C268F|nr:hypothetical protein [Facklamia sp. 7083-14-GEN3]MCR8968852.1 hypothetical protein [Facklamia sp. 7083-14-GEN3]